MVPRIKRLIDIVIALAAAIFLLPLLGLVALAILIVMGRPIIFRQIRPGQSGKPFVLYKFRSMRDPFDASGSPLPDERRLTCLGQFLRATSIDELPQLWNVLRGEMSLVGPRPKMPEDMLSYTPEQARRLSVLPGITGWAQIHGRNSLELEEIYRHDIWYLDHWSLWLDLKILALTPLFVFKAEGITGRGQSPVTQIPSSLHSLLCENSVPSASDLSTSGKEAK